MVDSESKFVDLLGRGIRLHYRDWSGDGPPLVLLHGLASGSRIWDFTAPLLVSNFRVIALDQRGHGLSDKPGDYGFADVVADLSAFAAGLGLKRPVIAGHSWGGNVALEFAAQHPESIAGLILVDGGFLEISSFEGMTWERAEMLMRPPEIDGVPVEAFLRAARSFPQFADLWSDQLQEMFISNFEIRDGKVYRRLPIDDHMKIVRAMWEQRPSQMWSKLRCPLLMMPALDRSAAQANEMWLDGKRKAIEFALSLVPEAKVVWMEDTIHDAPIQRPRELADAIIDFAGTR